MHDSTDDDAIVDRIKSRILVGWPKAMSEVHYARRRTRCSPRIPVLPYQRRAVGVDRMAKPPQPPRGDAPCFCQTSGPRVPGRLRLWSSSSVLAHLSPHKSLKVVDCVEVAVDRCQLNIVLDARSRDPQIVLGNRFTLGLELQSKPRIHGGGRQGDVHHPAGRDESLDFGQILVAPP